MTYLENTFEGFANGTAFTTANSGSQGGAAMTNVAAGSGGTYTTVTTDAAHGTVCLEAAHPSAIAGQFDLVDPTPATSGVCAFMFKLLAYPTVTNIQFPILARHSAGQLGRLEMSTTGQLRVNMTAVSAYSLGLSLNTWYRIEVICTGWNSAASAFTVNVYVGDSNTLFTSATVTGQTTAFLQDRFRYDRGSNEATAISCRFDTIRQNIGSSTPLGPFITNATANDTATQSDATAATVVQGFAVNDNAVQSEGTTTYTSVISTSDAAFSLSESMTDTVSDNGLDDLFQTEGTTVIGAGVAVIDSASQIENTTLLGISNPSVDSMTQTEVGAATVDVAINVTDTSTFTDVSSSSMAVGAFDTAIQDDNSFVAQQYAAFDDATQSEDTTLLVSVFSVNDTATQTEVSGLGLASSVVDSATQSEGTTAPIDQFYSANDSATQSEGTTAYTAALSANDSFAFTDVSTLNAGGAFNVTDSATQSDPTPVITDATVANDSAVQSEVSLLTVTLSAFDTFSNTEGTTQLNVSLAANDPALQDESSALFSGQTIAAADFATQGEDATTIDVDANASDTFFLSENAAILVTLAANDSSVFFDSINIDRLSNTTVVDVATLNGEFAVVQASGVDEGEFTVVKIYFPDLNTTTNITIRSSE
jgi:hypothetical protein